MKNHIQKSKEDWWECMCGEYHKEFPYKCPNKQEGVKQIVNRNWFLGEMIKTQSREPNKYELSFIELIKKQGVGLR